MKLQQEANRKIIELADKAQNEAVRLDSVLNIFPLSDSILVSIERIIAPWLLLIVKHFQLIIQPFTTTTI